MVRLIGRAYWFEFHFFSLPLILDSFFEPWKRLGEEHGEKFHLQQWAQATIINTLMRLIGIALRSMILIFALIALIATTFVIALFVAAWCILPLLILALIVKSIVLIVS